MMRKVAAAAAILFALALLPSVARADGPIGYDQMRSYLRTPTMVGTFWAPDLGANTNNQVAGRAGVIMVGSMNALNHVTQTSSITALPYPCRVMAYVKDGNNSGVSTCTGTWTICGRDGFGGVNQASATNPSAIMCESITTDLVEGTPVKTARVYETITSFTISGCSGGSNAADLVQLACSPDIGLPMPITSTNAILSLCAIDASGSLEPYCWKASQISEDINTTYEYVALFDNVVNTAGVGDSDVLNFTWNDGDLFEIRMRSPDGRK